MTASFRKTDYDAIAATYDNRYAGNDYADVDRALADFVDCDSAGPILETGCGTGHWLRSLSAKGIRAIGVDASANMLARARAQDPAVAIVRGLAERLPFARASFSGLIAVNALHHFEDKIAFFAEAHRVLRPGGELMTIGLDPHSGVERWWIYDYFEPALEIDRRRYPATAAIREWMRDVGFADCATRVVMHRPVRLPASQAIAEGRLRKDWTSQLVVLTDEEYARGMARIETALEAAAARGETLMLSADLRVYGTIGVAR